MPNATPRRQSHSASRTRPWFEHLFPVEFRLIFMFVPESPKSEDVEHLLRNAQLRDELEPLFDESIDRVNPTAMSTRSENEFLESMLEWERAPMLPISQWFDPPLVLPHPDRLGQHQLSLVLRATIEKLFEKRIVLDFTDHLSDYQLYALIFRDILPSHEKKLERRTSYLHWDCANIDENPDVWLRFYASPVERQMWAEEYDQPLPPHDEPPFKREVPRAPLVNFFSRYGWRHSISGQIASLT